MAPSDTDPGYEEPVINSNYDLCGHNYQMPTWQSDKATQSWTLFHFRTEMGAYQKKSFSKVQILQLTTRLYYKV